MFGYVELNGKLPEGTRGPNNDDDTASSTTAVSLPLDVSLLDFGPPGTPTSTHLEPPPLDT